MLISNFALSILMTSADEDVFPPDPEPDSRKALISSSNGPGTSTVVDDIFVYEEVAASNSRMERRSVRVHSALRPRNLVLVPSTITTLSRGPRTSYYQ